MVNRNSAVDANLAEISGSISEKVKDIALLIKSGYSVKIYPLKDNKIKVVSVKERLVK